LRRERLGGVLRIVGGGLGMGLLGGRKLDLKTRLLSMRAPEMME